MVDLRVLERPTARSNWGMSEAVTGYAPAWPRWMETSMDTIVIDIDGTLLDSNYHHCVAWSRAFQVFEVSVPVARIHRALGMGGDRLVTHVAGQRAEDLHGDDIRDRWESEYDAIIGETRLFEGSRDLLRSCRTRGLKVALASSAIPRHAEHALELLGASDLADGWTTSEDADESKPAPDLLDGALDRVQGREAFMVGDAVWDVKAAAERRIPTIGVTSGGVSRAELIEAGAVGAYDGPRDLIDHLDEAVALALAKRPPIG